MLIMGSLRSKESPLVYQSIFVVIAVFLLQACQTVPFDYSQTTEGQWTGRVLVEDFRKGQSPVVLKTDINAVKDQKLRIDLSTSLGFHAATLVMNPRKLEAVVPRNKQYFYGPVRPSSLKPFLKFAMDPNLFYNLLFDQPIPQKNWTCTATPEGLVESCERLDGRIKARWFDRQGKKKTVEIRTKTHRMQIRLVTFEPKVKEQANLFTLKVPKALKRIRL